MQFIGHAVGIVESETDNHLTVVFADDDGDPEHVLELAVAMRFDDQDRALGMATYSITIDAAATTYGGVERCRLTDSALELRLSGSAAQILGADRDLLVTLDRDGAPHAALAAALRRVFAADLPGAPNLVIGEAGR